MGSPTRTSLAAALLVTACAFEPLGPAGLDPDATPGDAGERADASDEEDAGAPDGGHEGDGGSESDGGVERDAGAPDGGGNALRWTAEYEEEASTILPGVHAFDLLEGAPITAYTENDTLYVARAGAGGWTRRAVTITNGLVLRQPACALTPQGQLAVAGFVSGRGVWEGTLLLAPDPLVLTLAPVEDSGRTYADLRLAISATGRRVLVYRSWTANMADRRVRLKVGASGILDEYKETDALDLALDSDGDPLVLAKWQSSLFLSKGATDLEFESLWGNAQSASIASRGDVTAIAWGDESRGVTTFSVNTDGSDAWVPGTLAGPKGGTAGTAIAEDGSNGLVVAWPAENGGFEVWAAKNGWARIGVPEGLLTGPLQYPRLRAAADGTLHVVAHVQGDPGRSLPATIVWLRYGR